jgi:hypothetical protein
MGFMGMEQFNPWKPVLQKHSPGLLHPPLTHPPHKAVKVRMVNKERVNLGCSLCLAMSILQRTDHTSPLSNVVCSCIRPAARMCPLGIQICRWLEVRLNQSNRNSRVVQAVPVQPSVHMSHRAPVAVGLQVQTLDAVHSPFTHSGSQAAGQ